MAATDKTKTICKICNSTDILNLGRVTNGNYSKDFLKDYSLLKCNRCLLEFIHPVPSNKVLDFIYSNPEYSAWEVVSKREKTKGIRYQNFEYYLKIIRKYKKNGKILDCGCATGCFLDVARKNGFDCYGIETSEIPFSVTEKKYSGKIFKLNLEDLDFSKGFFDIVTMFDFIEHVKNPKEVLKKASYLLSNKGLLVLTTPDTRSLSMSVLRKSHTNYILEHLNLFNKANLPNFLKKFGFETIKMMPAKKILNLKYAEKVFKTHKNFLLYPTKFINNLLPRKIYELPIKVSFGDMFIIAKKKR